MDCRVKPGNDGLLLGQANRKCCRHHGSVQERRGLRAHASQLGVASWNLPGLMRSSCSAGAAHSRTGGVGAPFFSHKETTGRSSCHRVKPRGDRLRTRAMMLLASSRWCRSSPRQDPHAQKRKRISRLLDRPRFNRDAAMASARKCLAQNNKSLNEVRSTQEENEKEGALSRTFRNEALRRR